LYHSSQLRNPQIKINILGSGSILLAAEKAQVWLESKMGIAVDLWNVTSYTELRREALEIDRWNRLHPASHPKTPFIATLLNNGARISVAASDFMKSLPDALAKWVPVPLISLGTDGFGRSESREALREFFEVNENHIAWAALTGLHEQKLVSKDTLLKAQNELTIIENKLDPMIS
jgi:pyruvate dehydrogenase E1 component